MNLSKKANKNKFSKKNLCLIIFICFLQIIYSIAFIGSFLLIGYTIQAAAAANEPVNILYGLILDPNNYSIPIWLIFLYSLIGFTLAAVILNFIVTCLQVISTAEIKFHAQNRITNYIENLEYTKKVTSHDNWLSWYTNDSETIAGEGLNNFFSTFGSSSKIVFGLISFALLNWILFIICLFLIILGIFFPLVFKKYIENNYEKLSKSNENWVAQTSNILKLYNTVYFWNAFLVFNKLLKKESQNFQNNATKALYNLFKIYILGSVLIGHISTIIVLVSSLLVVLLISNTDIAIIIAGSSISLSLFSNLFSFCQTFSECLGAKKIWNKFSFKLNNKKQKINIFEKININLSEIKYENKIIKNNVDLEISNSKKVLIVGPSGSGKSSLLKLITGEINSYSGLLTANKINYQDLDLNSLHQSMWQIGSGNYHIFKDASLKDNITLFDKNFDQEMFDYALNQSESNLLKNRTEEIINLDSKIPYSEGQLQQIEFARFFYHMKQKKLLLVDESLANIDSDKRNKIQQNLIVNPEFALVEVSHHFDLNLKNQFDQVIDFESETK